MPPRKSISAETTPPSGTPDTNATAPASGTADGQSAPSTDSSLPAPPPVSNPPDAPPAGAEPPSPPAPPPSPAAVVDREELLQPFTAYLAAHREQPTAVVGREELLQRTRAILSELPEPVPVLAPAIVDAIAAVPDEHRADYAELIRATAAVNRGIIAAGEGLRALWALCRSESGRELLTARGIDAETVGIRLLDILTPDQPPFLPEP